MNRLLHLHQFGLWMNTLPIRAWLNSISRTQIYAIPLIQWIHILGVALICGSVVLIGLRMMGFLKFSPPLADMARRLLPWTWFAIVVNVITGVIMVLDRPTRATDSLTFPYSMIFLIVATILSIYFAITLRRDPDYWERSGSRRGTARLLGALSTLLWIGVIFGDRLIFYAKGPI